MSRAGRVVSGWLGVALLACSMAAHAGRSCEMQKPTPASVVQGLALAQRTAQALDASGAQVVVLARAGQNLQRYGITWSHLGFAYRTAEGPWRVVHKLNQCGSASGFVYRQGLGEFFLDAPWRYQAAWSVPTPAVQARLLAQLQTPGAALVVDAPAYSMVSYAWGQRYQQSNQWAIETLAVAMAPETAGSRAMAQGWLRAQGYQPAVLHIGPLERLGGRMTAANIAFDDHPPAERFSDRIATVTADSVFGWLQASRLGSAPVVLR
jgi:hypothetical protein